MPESMREPDMQAFTRRPKPVADQPAAEAFLGHSQAMRHVMRRIEQFARDARRSQLHDLQFCVAIPSEVAHRAQSSFDH